MGKFKVYCHTNQIDGKKYVGITKQKLNRRFRNGDGYKDSLYFYNAIKKYGWDNFKTEILFDNLSEKDAKDMEIKLIDELKSKSPNGYNLTDGGDGVFGYDKPKWLRKQISERTCGENNPMYGVHINKKPINQYTLDGELVAKWDSMVEASNATGICSKSISDCCVGNRMVSNGFVWAYDSVKDIDFKDIRKRHYPYKNGVRLYDLDGNLLGEWGSYAKLERYIGCSNGSVSYNIRNNLKVFLGKYKLEKVG